MTYSDMIRVFGRIGCLSFGGPAGQIALMQRELVEERPLLSQPDFLKALSFCMMLPGPEAMQLATYAGWKLRGLPGGLIAGGLFVLPGAVLIAVLALAYGSFGTLPLVQAAFLGIKAAVIIIVVQAILRLLSKALGRSDHRIIAIIAFLALFLFNLPFPLVIAAAAAYGAITCADHTTPKSGMKSALPWRASIAPIVFGGLLWALPLLAAWIAGASFLLAVGLFFSKLAVVTFGGAYAVLAYVTQAVVTDFGWLSTAQMIDALGLAETTPGPLILVTEFTGILAGLGEGGVGLGLLAGLMTLWVTFVPCFIWIFAGAPMIDWLDGYPRIRSGLAAITAAVVGVIANLSLWFAAHVVFDQVGTATGVFSVLIPDWQSFNVPAAALTILAALLLLWRKMPLGRVLILMALAGIALSVVT